jgi:hypothetical protein
VLRDLDAAVGSAKRANEVLERASDSYRVPVDNLVAQVDYLRFRLDGLNDQLSA